jgi:hypothetical protein
MARLPTILAEMHRLVQEGATYGPEEIKNTGVSFGCHLNRRPLFAPGGHAVPALGVTDRALRHGAGSDVAMSSWVHALVQPSVASGCKK